MKALTLWGTLKPGDLLDMETLPEFFVEHFKNQHIGNTIIKLVEHTFLPGTYSNMGYDGKWPDILKKILLADILVFAIPALWINQPSEMIRVIEQHDELQNEIMEGEKRSPKAKQVALSLPEI